MNAPNSDNARRWRSCARWAHKHGFQDDLTTDLHDSKGQAVAVCDMLMRNGLDGEECHFPLDTWVEEAPVEQSGTPAQEPSQAVRVQRMVRPSTELPDNAAVAMAVVNCLRYVQWEGCKDLHYAPRWVWQLVHNAERGSNR